MEKAVETAGKFANSLATGSQASAENEQTAKVLLDVSSEVASH
jgi:hypothetical protein